MSLALRRAHGSIGARVLGVGSFQPERVVDNEELAQLLGTTAEWIGGRVGIAQRRFAGKDESVVDMAVAAGRAALVDARVDPRDVDLVILASCTRPAPIPHGGPEVAYRLGVPAPGAFDLNATCAGFCYGLGIASDAIRAGSAERVLVIASEKLTDMVDPLDSANAIIFADGAGAAVVEASDRPDIGPVAWGSVGRLASALTMPDHRFIAQDGRTIFGWAIKNMAPIALRAIELAGLRPSDVDVVITHQANLRVVKAAERQLRLHGVRPDVVVADDVKWSGNTSSASVPIALDHMREAGVAKPGDAVVCVAPGAGLSYAAQVIICP